MTPRLFVEAELVAGAAIELGAERAHYLRDVLRLEAGAAVMLFNARDGEWLASIESVARRAVTLRLARQTRLPAVEPDLWLCFAPIKRTRLDFIAEKATELGVSVLQPVVTERTVVERVKRERLQANAIEAAEQTERLGVPQVREALPLGRLLASWPAGRHVLLADESGHGQPIADVLTALPGAMRAQPWAVLVGPEGGFTPAERDAVARLPDVHAVSLGPRILRADTAAVAALAVWQALLGDWREAVPRPWTSPAATGDA